jgi:hypothetical protein
MYVSITECLQYILNPGLHVDENLQDNWAWDAETKVIAQGILSTLSSFSFLVSFLCVQAVLETVKPVTAMPAKLEKHYLDVNQAFTLVAQRVATVKTCVQISPLNFCLRKAKRWLISCGLI